MARLRQNTKVQLPPRVKGFKPVGDFGDQCETIQLNIGEFEVIRLLDYESLSQKEAAIIMEVSRPTLTRIYLRVRKKIACMLTEAAELQIEGGTAVFEGNWFSCNICLCRFNQPSKSTPENYPLCNNSNIIIH